MMCGTEQAFELTVRMAIAPFWVNSPNITSQMSRPVSDNHASNDLTGRLRQTSILV